MNCPICPDKGIVICRSHCITCGWQEPSVRDTSVTLTAEEALRLLEAGSSISILLTDARITHGGLCSEELVSAAQKEYRIVHAALKSRLDNLVAIWRNDQHTGY